MTESRPNSLAKQNQLLICQTGISNQSIHVSTLLQRIGTFDLPIWRTKVARWPAAQPLCRGTVARTSESAVSLPPNRPAPAIAIPNFRLCENGMHGALGI